MNRIYIPKDGELDEQKVEDLVVWIADNVPSAPEGQRCETDDCHFVEDGERPLADGSFSFKVEGDHVCYSYVCEGCQEDLTPADEYIAETSFPGAGGYARTPKHCT